jgi:hypothetical protein
VRRDQRSPGGVPLDLAWRWSAEVPQVEKASENGNYWQMRTRTHKSEAKTKNSERKVAKSAAPALVHLSHAAHKAAGTAACIPALVYAARCLHIHCHPPGVTLDLA